MLGIQNLKGALSFAIGLGQAFDRTFADGQFQFPEVINFVAPLSQAPKSADEWKAIKAELADLSSGERMELDHFIQDEFDIANDRVEAVIEDSIDLVLHIWTFVADHFLQAADEAGA